MNFEISDTEKKSIIIGTLLSNKNRTAHLKYVLDAFEEEDYWKIASKITIKEILDFESKKLKLKRRKK